MLLSKQRLKAIEQFAAQKAAAEQSASTSSSSSSKPAVAMATIPDDFPRMPTDDLNYTHLDKIQAEGNLFNVAVARTVCKKEVLEVPAAQAAVTAEWDKLRKCGCWDESKVEEWATVAKRARDNGTTTHVGRVRLRDLC